MQVRHAWAEVGAMVLSVLETVTIDIANRIPVKRVKNADKPAIDVYVGLRVTPKHPGNRV